jgi:spermidine synthase
VAAVVRQPDGSRVLFTHGFGESTFPYGGIHTLLGAVPVAVHPQPRRVAVVGLGSGDTAWAAGARTVTERVDVMELVAPQGALLRRMAARDGDAALLLGDPRVRFLWVDGRQALLRAGRDYDVVEIDAVEPTNAGSGNVNSIEFFEIVAAHLAPGGLLCAWTPTPRSRAAFQAVFPHALEFSGYDTSFVVGSLAPLNADAEAWRERAAGLSARLGDERLRGLQASLATARPLEPPAPGAPVNRDLFPADEFRSPYPSP